MDEQQKIHCANWEEEEEEEEEEKIRKADVGWEQYISIQGQMCRLGSLISVIAQNVCDVIY